MQNNTYYEYVCTEYTLLQFAGPMRYRDCDVKVVDKSKLKQLIKMSEAGEHCRARDWGNQSNLVSASEHDMHIIS